MYRTTETQEETFMNTPAQITQTYAALGKTKATTPKSRLFALAVLAGIFIAAAGVGSLIGTSLLGPLAGACIFPAGLAMVVLAGSELFTGDNLMVISLLDRKISLSQLLVTWVIVYVGNFAGALLVSWITVQGGTFQNEAYQASLLTIAANKVSLSFGTAFLRGVMCNLLVCVAVWMTMAATDVTGKVAGLFFPIMVFVLCGYEHCVANMFYIPAGLLASAKYDISKEGLTWGAMLGKNFLPVTLGNIVGGAGLGAAFWGIHHERMNH
jgi:formate/nitrite transporter